MNKNKLKLNEEKTELLVVGDRTRLSQVNKEPLTFGPNAVPFQTSAKYLGVHLDETLSMREQVTSLCRSSYFHLRKISSIRPYLWDESTAQLVSSLILSRLDYCNSILSGLPSCSLNRLQNVQNNAARLVLRKRKSDHVTPLLKEKKTTLAPCWRPYPLHNCHTGFQALWEFSSSVPFRTASHLPTLWNSSVQQWKTVESPQN